MEAPIDPNKTAEAKTELISEVVRRSAELDTAQAYQEGGELLVKLGLHEAALRQYKISFERDPSNVDVITEIIELRRRLWKQGLGTEVNKILGLTSHIEAHKNGYRGDIGRCCLE